MDVSLVAAFIFAALAIGLVIGAGAAFPLGFISAFLMRRLTDAEVREWIRQSFDDAVWVPTEDEGGEEGGENQDGEGWKRK
jgi:hypothetical protein